MERVEWKSFFCFFSLICFLMLKSFVRLKMWHQILWGTCTKKFRTLRKAWAILANPSHSVVLRVLSPADRMCKGCKTNSFKSSFVPVTVSYFFLLCSSCPLGDTKDIFDLVLSWTNIHKLQELTTFISKHSHQKCLDPNYMQSRD